MVLQVISEYSPQLHALVSMGIRMPRTKYNSCKIAGSSQAMQTKFLFLAHRHRLVFLLGTINISGSGWAPAFLLGPA